MRRRGLLGLIVAGVLLAGIVHAGERVDLEAMRDRLMAAKTRAATDAALDELAARIGQEPGFPDAAAFADYLGRLPPEAASRPRVLLRRGWGYLAAGRSPAAVSVLETIPQDGSEDAMVALAYLGEAARQTGDLAQAFRRLEAAASAGYRDAFLVDCVLKAAWQLRSRKASRDFEGLPEYVGALEGFLGVMADPHLDGILARWLLDDYGAYAVPGRERARRWASTAATHALAALAGEGAQAGGDGARLAFDAAEALAPEDGSTGGRTPRFDLLAWAWRLGDRPDEDSHALPAAIARLAEAALAEERYELAARLARQRLAISDSPAARRVLAALPPDVGD